MNGDKAEQKLYVTGITCLPETAYERMMATKKQFHKTDSVLAYHAYQSYRILYQSKLEVRAHFRHAAGIE